MSISVVGVELTPLLKTIPALFEKSDLLKFTFGPEPIIKLIAWQAVTLKVDFIGAAPNFVVTWCVLCRSIFSVRLNGACVVLQGHISPAFQCHTRTLPIRSPNEIVSQ
jgi:hypothetical protein